MRITLEYENPWYTPFSASPKVYQRDDAPVFKTDCGRGMIVKVNNRHYDYLVDGKVVTQRCGNSMNVMNKLLADRPTNLIERD